MALNIPSSFDYPPGIPPRLSVRITADATSRVALGRAFVDTGADGTLLDIQIANRLRLNLDSAPVVLLGGVGGGETEAKSALVVLELADNPALRMEVSVVFAPGVEATCGNLIGLNVLQHFDFALQHSVRRGYLGPTGGA